GPQEVANGVLHFSQVASVAGRTGVIQPVVVIATINTKGKVEEAETPPNSEAGLSEAAISLVKHTTYERVKSEGVPYQRLAYINVKFVPGK
ncbi:MAG: energy transducer TonB, partial [Terriglobales bacterium]